MGEGAAVDVSPCQAAMWVWGARAAWKIPTAEDSRLLMRLAADRPERDPPPLERSDLESLIAVGLLDVEYYKKANGLVLSTEADAVEHFRRIGCRAPFRPNPVFDNIWYLSRYRDIAAAAIPPLLHYFRNGEAEGRRPALWFDAAWYSATYSNEIDYAGVLAHYLRSRKTGRFSPNPLFDCNFYLERNRAAVRAMGGDPFEHFLLKGHAQDLDPSASFDVKAYRAERLGGKRGDNPLLHAIARELAYDPDAPEAAEEPAVYPQGPAMESVGFAEESKPSAGVGGDAITTPTPTLFVSTSMASDAEVATIVSEARQRIRAEFQSMTASKPALSALLAEARGSVGPQWNRRSYPENLKPAAAVFDFDFYWGAYDDVRLQEADPLHHYVERGWKQGYDPAPWFSTRYYLTANPDVAEAGVNPFLHFVALGRREGRSPKRASFGARLLESAPRSPEEKAAHYCAPEHRRIERGELVRVLTSALSVSDGVAVSVSHDCYPLVVGGTQIFISDEQRKFNERNYAYVHLSPLLGGLTLRKESETESICRMVVNGEAIGAAAGAEVADALEAALGDFERPRIFVTHCALGHSVSVLLRVHRALRPTESFYWLHDYSSVCAGFLLLRNDVSFCGAPPLGSMACSICVYGASRRAHLADMAKLFDDCSFRVLSPSESTRKIWTQASTLPYRDCKIVAHSVLEATEIWRDARPVETIGTPGEPVRIAFIGYKSIAKGWVAFERAVREACGLPGYRFYLFASPEVESEDRRVVKVDVSVTPQDRDAMIRALEKENIDIVVGASICPETFSFTTHEALAAGCDVITVAGSGNIAAKIEESGRGLVFSREDELVDFFVGGAAIAWVRARAREGICRATLRHTGTTASVLFAGV